MPDEVLKMTRKLLTGLILVCSLLSWIAPVVSAAGKEKKIKIRGYITNIVSPTSFEIDEYKITKDESIVLDFENKDEKNPVQFKPEDIRIGTEIEVQGIYNEETNELKATKVKIDLDQFRKLKNTAVLTHDVGGVEKTLDGWKGTFWADGRRIRIEPSTKVLFELNKTEKKVVEKEAKEKQKQKGKGQEEVAEQSEDDEFANSAPLGTVSEVKAGMFFTYEGVEQPDGTVLASRVLFMKNELEKGESDLWKSFKLKEKPSNFAEGNPGELKIDRVGKFKLLPNKEVQDFVTRIGERVIPAYQKNMAADDPLKIPFKFYVINEKSANAFALANGVIVVHSGLITTLESEGQLAAVLAHEVAHSTQEHTWRQLNKDKGKRTAIMIGSIAAAAFGLGGVSDILQLTLAAMVNGYSRKLENQSDRLGLEYMVAGGYDPREAPRVWKVMGAKYGDSPTNLFWSSHENKATRRSFLMVEIRNNYSHLDLNSMRRGDEAEYERIVLLTKDAAAKKKKIKVTS